MTEASVPVDWLSHRDAGTMGCTYVIAVTSCQLKSVCRQGRLNAETPADSSQVMLVEMR